MTYNYGVGGASSEPEKHSEVPEGWEKVGETWQRVPNSPKPTQSVPQNSSPASPVNPTEVNNTAGTNAHNTGAGFLPPPPQSPLPPGYGPPPPGGSDPGRRRNVLILLALGLVTLLVVGLAYFSMPDKSEQTAAPSSSSSPSIDPGALQSTCDVANITLMKAFSTLLVTNYSVGAICRWTVYAQTIIDVSYSWFEKGSIDREKQTDQALGYSVTPKTVEGHNLIEIKIPDQPQSCAAMAGALKGGVVQYWVQPRDTRFSSSCEVADKLVILALGGDF